jgi:hypothetical protein
MSMCGDPDYTKTTVLNSEEILTIKNFSENI